MKLRFLNITFCMTLCAGSLPLSSHAETLKTLQAAAQSAFAQRWELGQTARAIELYEKILEQSPDLDEYWVKLAYAYYWRGNRLELEEHSKKERLESYTKSVSAARRAIQVNPDSIGGNYWMVISQGRYTQVHGILGGTFSLGDNIRGMQIVTSRNPNYYFGGVDRYWGRVVFEIPKIVQKLIDFQYEDSLYLFERSLAFEPHFFTTRLYIGETHLKLGDREKAREAFTWLLTTPADILPAAEAENRLEQEIARKLWRKHFKEPIPGASGE